MGETAVELGEILIIRETEWAFLKYYPRGFCG
jgi:hypothetical protein